MDNLHNEKLFSIQAGDEESLSQTMFLDCLEPGQIATSLLNTLPDIVFWVKDAVGRYVYVNDAFTQLVTNLSEVEVIGKLDIEIFPEELSKLVRADDLRIMRSEEPMMNKVELVPNVTGGVEWCSTSKIPLKNKVGKIVGTAGLTRRVGVTEGRPVPSQHKDMAAIVGAIYKCIDQDLRVQEIAEAANISVSTLERTFKEHMGTTPKKFIIHAKVATACDSLMNTRMSVKEIGLSVGYPDHANFTRAFRKLMNMSPSDYRSSFSK